MSFVFMREGRDIPLVSFLCVVEVESSSKETTSLNLIMNHLLFGS